MSRLAPWPVASHQRAAQALKAQPGLWRRVAVYRASYTAKAMAGRIRTGRELPVYGPAGSFEARTEIVGDCTAVVARYVGGRA